MLMMGWISICFSVICMGIAVVTVCSDPTFVVGIVILFLELVILLLSFTFVLINVFPTTDLRTVVSNRYSTTTTTRVAPAPSIRGDQDVLSHVSVSIPPPTQ